MLDQDIKQSATIQVFKYKLNLQLRIPPIYFNIILTSHLGQILHTRLMLECSSLNHHLHVNMASVAQWDAPSNWRPGGRGFNPRRGRQHSFVEIDHEIFSTVILSLPLIQEGQLSVSGERMCTILVNR